MKSKKIITAVLSAAIAISVTVPVFAVRNVIGHTATVEKAEQEQSTEYTTVTEETTETTTANKIDTDGSIAMIDSLIADDDTEKGEGVIRPEYRKAIYDDITGVISAFSISFSEDKPVPDANTVETFKTKWLNDAATTNEKLYAQAAVKAYGIALKDVVIINSYFFKYMVVEKQSYIDAKTDIATVQAYVSELKNAAAAADVDAVSEKLLSIYTLYEGKYAKYS